MIEVSFWSWMSNTPTDPADTGLGDGEGIEFVGDPVEDRGFPSLSPSAWAGWPANWDTPNWTAQSQFNRLIDIAWTCLDLNSNVVSAMPVYRLKDGYIVDPLSWMINPDPMIYTSWLEFMKQVFLDFQMGEVFILPMVTGSDGYPLRFRVIPPFLINVEMQAGRRVYSLGNRDVTDEILHIRYQSSTADARGHGPLEAAGARITAIGLLQRYGNHLAETGGTPHYWISVDRVLRNKQEAVDLLEQWIETRSKYAGHPAVLGSNATLNQARAMDAKNMALMELSQFHESRIAVMLGVPPFLVGLAGASGSLTYSNIADLFDYHDRSSLRPKVRMIMEALTQWALPRGQSVEVNRDDYTRLPLDKRYNAYKVGIDSGFLTTDDVRGMERLESAKAAQALTGGAD